MKGGGRSVDLALAARNSNDAPQCEARRCRRQKFARVRYTRAKWQWEIALGAGRVIRGIKETKSEFQ
jgi:hypothetical protein